MLDVSRHKNDRRVRNLFLGGLFQLLIFRLFFRFIKKKYFEKFDFQPNKKNIYKNLFTGF